MLRLCTAGKASWVKVPQRGATELTRVQLLVAAWELGKIILAAPSVGVWGKTHVRRNKWRIGLVGEKKVMLNSKRCPTLVSANPRIGQSMHYPETGLEKICRRRKQTKLAPIFVPMTGIFGNAEILIPIRKYRPIYSFRKKHIKSLFYQLFDEWRQ